MLEQIRHENTLEIRLARPPVNALDPALVAAVHEAVIKAPASGARALVISGSTGLFSAGLDVPVLLGLDRDAMIRFWKAFNAMLGAVGRCPLPTVAAITGHSPAGGAVLSLYCDYRVMARGTYRIGLNEVQVGLSIPASIQATLRRLVGAHRAERMMVAGAMLDSEAALRVGLVDELVDVDHVVARALEWCRQHLALPPEAMAETRRMARADLYDLLDAAEKIPVDAFIERWFSEETQTTLTALVAKLKAKSAG